MLILEPGIKFHVPLLKIFIRRLNSSDPSSEFHLYDNEKFSQIKYTYDPEYGPQKKYKFTILWAS